MTVRYWDRPNGNVECSECSALVYVDTEGFAERQHTAWHEHLDDVERTLTQLLEALGMVAKDGTVVLPKAAHAAREKPSDG